METQNQQEDVVILILYDVMFKAKTLQKMKREMSYTVIQIKIVQIDIN
jgi:hypothetical protein